MDVPLTPRRRIVRRAVMVVAVVVLLPAAYICAYGETYWLWGRGTISIRTLTRLELNVFAPLHYYDGPGSKSLREWCGWCHWMGAGRPPPLETVSTPYGEVLVGPPEFSGWQIPDE